MQLKPYQETGVDWLRAPHRFRLLADEMGLGKTAQAIMALKTMGIQRVNVICPAIARPVWQHEMQLWGYATGAYVVRTGRGIDRIAGALGPVICSYDLASEVDIAKALAMRLPEVTIFDECHYLKHPGSERTKRCVGGYGTTKNNIAAYSGKVWALSGTPAPNHNGEMFTWARLAGEWTGSHAAFLERYTDHQVTDYGYKVNGPRNQGELVAKMRPHFLRRRKMDVLKELPPIEFSTVSVEPRDLGQLDVLAAYRAHAEDLERAAHRAFQTDNWAAAELSISTALRFVGLAKVANTVDLVRAELGDSKDRNIAIFAHHKSVIDALAKRFSAMDAVFIRGGDSDEHREWALGMFREGKARIIVLSREAANTAITLTNCADALILEPAWVPGTNAQAGARLHRIGQTRPVRVRLVGLSGSVDEQVNSVLMRKINMLNGLYRPLEQVAS